MRSSDVTSVKCCHSLAELLPEMSWRTSAEWRTLHLTSAAPKSARTAWWETFPNTGSQLALGYKALQLFHCSRNLCHSPAEN